MTAPTRPADRQRLHTASIEQWIAEDWHDALRHQRARPVRPADAQGGRAASPRQEIAGAIALLAVIVMLTVSDNFLTWIGHHYTVPGGGVL